MVLGSDIRWPDLVGFNVTRELDRELSGITREELEQIAGRR